MSIRADGSLAEPPRSAGGTALPGRVVCHDIQWTGEKSELVGTFTITARELLTYAESNLLWTDQDVQRGIKPEISGVDRELSLSVGYPDVKIYVFDVDKADQITESLLSGEKLFLNPLIWNLRPKHFEAFDDEKSHALRIYSGKIYLPDSHHRHQAIVKASSLFRGSPRDYPKFSLDKQFKIELYFLSKEDEGNYFYAKNQLPKPTSKSKAFDLTTQDDLSLLAKKFAESSRFLSGNVNRVTDRLAKRNPQVVTLSTLREMMRVLASDDHIDESEIGGLAAIAAEFFDMLASIRPELGHLSATDRNKVRSESLVDAGVMMHGYAALMRQYQVDIGNLGSSKARVHWQERLSRLSGNEMYSISSWTGDLFSKGNPLWQKVGVLKPNSSRRGVSVVSNGATRSEAGRILGAICKSEKYHDLSKLAAL